MNEAIVRYVNFDGTTDYDDKYFRHKTINNYFFRSKDGTNTYRWSTKKAVAFHPNTSYKIQFKILGGNEYGIKIGYPKIYEWAKNTYNEEFWREVPL